ncbi:hypothetical protein GEMRC1_013353 [Eukaryota sp. GEM-RC1]
MLPPGQQPNDYVMTIVGRLIDSDDMVSTPVTITAIVTPGSSSDIYDRMENVTQNIDRGRDIGSQISTMAQTLNSMDNDEESQEVRRRVRQQLLSELEVASTSIQTLVSDAQELDGESRSTSARTLSNLAKGDDSDDETDTTLVSVADSLIADSDDLDAESLIDSISSIAKRSSFRQVCGQIPFEAAGSALGIKSAKLWTEDITEEIEGVQGEAVVFPENLSDDECLGYHSISMSDDYRGRSVSATGTFTLSLTSSTDVDLEVAGLDDPIVISLGEAQEHGKGETVVCKFWDTDVLEWSTEGVETVYKDGEVLCKTTHLTTFTGILSTKSRLWILFVVVGGLAVFAGFTIHLGAGYLWRKNSANSSSSSGSTTIEVTDSRNVPGSVV